MPVETAADRAAFFSADEFGCVVLYVRDGATTEIAGLFERPWGAALGGADAAAVGQPEPLFVCAAADLPAGAGEDDTFTVLRASEDGLVDTAWRVVGPVAPDGMGLAALTLETLE